MNGRHTVCLGVMLCVLLGALCLAPSQVVAQESETQPTDSPTYAVVRTDALIFQRPASHPPLEYRRAND